MALGLDFDSIIAKLGQNPAVQKAMAEFTELRNGIVQTVIHFNARFDAVDKNGGDSFTIMNGRLIAMDAKLDRILVAIGSETKPAAEHNLLEVLGEQKIGLCMVDGCFDQTIHDHGEGPVANNELVTTGETLFGK